MGKRTSLVDLKTAGVITLDADDVTGDAFISAGSVKLEADQLHILSLIHISEPTRH